MKAIFFLVLALFPAMPAAAQQPTQRQTEAFILDMQSRTAPDYSNWNREVTLSFSGPMITRVNERWNRNNGAHLESVQRLDIRDVGSVLMRTSQGVSEDNRCRLHVVRLICREPECIDYVFTRHRDMIGNSHPPSRSADSEMFPGSFCEEDMQSARRLGNAFAHLAEIHGNPVEIVDELFDPAAIGSAFD
ncbi:MAG: hypothetical protein ACPGID_00870 [Rubricella sp.]